MQSVPATAQAAGWRRRGRVLLLGVALTLPLDTFWVLALIGVYASLENPLLLFPISALFYLLIPGIEGFLTAKHSGEGCSGVDGGCLVGTISTLAFALATAAILIVAYPSYAESARGSGLFVGVALAAALLHATGCLIGGLLGGWAGGLLGRRYALAANQRSKTAEHKASEAP